MRSRFIGAPFITAHSITSKLILTPHVNVQYLMNEVYFSTFGLEKYFNEDLKIEESKLNVQFTKVLCDPKERSRDKLYQEFQKLDGLSKLQTKFTDVHKKFFKAYIQFVSRDIYVAENKWSLQNLEHMFRALKKCHM